MTDQTPSLDSLCETIRECPFCGRQPEISTRAAGEGERDNTTGQITFINCKCGTYSARAWQYGHTRAEAIAAWNTRAPIASERAKQEAGSREAFEAWAIKYYCSEIQERDGDSYTSHVLSDAWAGWQAVSKPAEVNLEKAAEEIITEIFGGTVATWADSRLNDVVRLLRKHLTEASALSEEEHSFMLAVGMVIRLHGKPEDADRLLRITRRLSPEGSGAKEGE
jgi:hypothetical protein